MIGLIEAVRAGKVSEFSSEVVKVYASSLTQVGDTTLLMVRTTEGKRLLAVGHGEFMMQSAR